MRGDVIHYDEAQGFGFIGGGDGNRYTFRREDLRTGGVIDRGTTVEFQPSGSQATSVFSLDAADTSPESRARNSVTPGPFGRNAVPAAQIAPREGGTGLWDYFRGCLTSDYANFNGRARRKEYWGYYLFWTISVMVIAGIGFAIDEAIGNVEVDAVPYTAIALSTIWYLGTLIPFIALTVRRHHDVGLSGWFVLFFFLLSFISVGWLILLVVALIPSQMHANKWGLVPEGISPPPAT